MTNRSLALLLIPLTCLAAGCSAHRRAGTGDVAFRLLWNGESDLDLYVVDPAGECIFFARPSSATGGVLDIDCNAGTDRLCTHPIENVFWPPGTAPAGTYTYWVDANSLINAEAPLAFELQLLRGKEVVWRHAGAVDDYRQERSAFALDFSRDRRRTLPVPAGLQRDPLGNWSNASIHCQVFPPPKEAPGP
jgi:hypothetical protein